jgi:catechol 2,3-dioxygenase-like lactoylglutathione lyase family enzyme
VNNTLQHFDINVTNLKKSKKFYSLLFKKIGWKIAFDEDWGAAWTLKKIMIIVVQTEKKYIKAGYHRKRPGLNHVCFNAKSKKEVDKFHKFLIDNKIPILYGGPKEYPEYEKGYYAVYFEDPDRVKLEIAHIPSIHKR